MVMNETIEYMQVDGHKHTSIIQIIGLNKDGNLEIFNGTHYIEFKDTEEAIDFLHTIGINQDTIKEIFEQ